MAKLERFIGWSTSRIPRHSAVFFPIILSSVLFLVVTLLFEELPITKLTFILTFSLLFQSALASHFLLREEILTYSEGLGKLSKPLFLSSIFGPTISTVIIWSGKYLFGLSLILAWWSTGTYEFEMWNLLFHVILISLLLDPLMSLFWEHEYYESIPERLTYISGYLSILLMGIAGTITNIGGKFDGDILYISLLSYVLLNARLVFFLEIALKEKTGIRVFSPFIIAFLFNFIQHIPIFLEQLEV